jgi:hypothetical protein
MRMTQNPNAQTSNTNHNIIEQVDEQKLQDINGGGIVCATVGCLSSINAGVAIKNVIKESRSSYFDERKASIAATAAVVHTNIASEALKTAASGYPICPNCVSNGVKYAAARIGGAKVS